MLGTLTPDQCADNYLSHASSIKHSVPCYIRHTQRQGLFNALPIDCRRHKATPLPARGPPTNPFSCFLCGEGPDHTTHVIGFCNITTAARQTGGCMIGISLQNSPHANGLGPPSSSPAPDAPSHATQRLANATVVFNWAVWHQRVTHFCYQPLPT